MKASALLKIDILDHDLFYPIFFYFAKKYVDQNESYLYAFKFTFINFYIF